jgi:hypothetical protein
MTNVRILGVGPQQQNIEIPDGTLLEFVSQPRDWRRIIVRWNDIHVTISSGAWASCCPYS